MIYNYLKEKLALLQNEPDKYSRALATAQQELDLFHDDFCRIWTYCCGCKGYSKLAEAYEDYAFDGAGRRRVVLKCGTCNSVWKFLE